MWRTVATMHQPRVARGGVGLNLVCPRAGVLSLMRPRVLSGRQVMTWLHTHTHGTYSWLLQHTHAQTQYTLRHTHTHAHTNMHTNTHTHTHKDKHTHTNTYKRTLTHAHAEVCTAPPTGAFSNRCNCPHQWHCQIKNRVEAALALTDNRYHAKVLSDSAVTKTTAHFRSWLAPLPFVVDKARETRQLVGHW